MRQLYHIAIDPGCRAIRIMLAEKSLECELRTEKVWERREVFLRLNPAGQVPVFIDEDGTTIAGTSVIAEYLEEVYPDPSLLGRDPAGAAESDATGSGRRLNLASASRLRRPERSEGSRRTKISEILRCPENWPAILKKAQTLSAAARMRQK